MADYGGIERFSLLIMCGIVAQGYRLRKGEDRWKRRKWVW